MHSSIIYASLSLLCVSAISVSSVKTEKPKPPHVVFVLVDDMGYNDFYTSVDLAKAWPTTAKLAAEECVHIGQYYTQPLCTPSRATFMTGRMPMRLGLQHGVINGVQDYGLPLDEVTLADKMSRGGYATYGVGKWHLGMYNNASTPTHRGFDHFYGYYNGYEDYFAHTVALGAKPGIDPVVDGYLDLHDDGDIVLGQHGDLRVRVTPTAIVYSAHEYSVYGPDLFLAKAEDYIKTHAARDPGSPMFLYYAMQNVHDPLQAKDEDRNGSACVGVPNSERRTFCGMASSADQALTDLTAALNSAFPGDDVLLVISGDNGGNTGSAGNNCGSITPNNYNCLRGYKATLWEGGVRNHALVCSRTLIPDAVKGTQYDGGLVHLMDLHPTLLDAAGLLEDDRQSGGKALDGVSMWSVIRTKAPSPRTHFIVNVDPCAGHGKCNGIESGIRDGDWKLMDNVTAATWVPVPDSDGVTVAAKASAHAGATPSTWLFNVTADPGETTNLAENFPDVVASLRAKVDAIVNGNDILPPCNIPGGSCVDENMTGWAVIKAANAWVPWVKDSLRV